MESKCHVEFNEPVSDGLEEATASQQLPNGCVPSAPGSGGGGRSGQFRKGGRQAVVTVMASHFFDEVFFAMDVDPE